MRTSVIIPTSGRVSLSYLLDALQNQTVKPNEIVLITRPTDLKKVRELCVRYNLNSIVLNQIDGFVARAYNIGLEKATGDLILFTDDDAIPPKNWIEKYVELHTKYPKNIGCICSRDIYLDIKNKVLLPTPDDSVTNRLYRFFVRTWLTPPHKNLTKYRLGVYVSKNYEVTHGPCIPLKSCYSLPFRGVNLSFKSVAITHLSIPESNFNKNALCFEQYLGVQMIKRSYASIYVPDNPVLHIAHKSLSRHVGERISDTQRLVLKSMYKEILERKVD